MAPLRHFSLIAVVTAALLTTPPAAAEPLLRSAAAAVEVPNIDDVRGHLTLPATGSGGTTITWRSSNAQVITATGEVSRPPAGAKPVKVVLTAEVRLGARRTTRALTATVVPLPVAVEAHEPRSPVLPGLNADPDIVAFGDTCYLHATTDGFDGWSGTRFSAWSSRNLADWTDEGVILDLGPGVSWADRDAWAVVERNGRYYFYFCAEAEIGVAVSDSPAGPFTDTGRPLVERNPGGGQAVDPAVFVDRTGQPYLYWGNGEAYVVPLNSDMISHDPAKITRLTGLADFREGLFMVERAGTCYLSWSVDDTRSEDYRVACATAPGPTGPFTNRGLVLAEDLRLGVKGAGHSSMLQVPGTDDWYLAHHRFAIPDGDGTHREITIDRMRFDRDGFIVPVRPTLESVAPQRIRPQHCRALVN